MKHKQKKRNLLAIDIGNSMIHAGVFRGKTLARHFKIAARRGDFRFYVCALKRELKKQCLSAAVICSVDPQETRIFKRVVKAMYDSKPLVVGQDIKVPIKNMYKNPRQLGSDRLLACFAALRLYGPGVIVVDFGTAITFDVVNKKGAFCGGLIFPGIELSLDALYQHTALLPRVSLSQPASLLGVDTKSAIQSGITYGIAGVCDAILQRLRKRYKGFTIVATGGNAVFFRHYSTQIKVIRPSLVLEGISFLFQ